jgi:ribonucleoside-diphosphate reductase alpha chain
VRFLDNVIDINKYPLQEIEKMTKGTRKIGLGIMGFADLLFQLHIPYNSKGGLEWAEAIMKCIYDEAKATSMQLAEERGTFPFWKGSTYEQQGTKMRNSTLTTIAPTGTIGMIADASGGLEPNFAISYLKRVMGGTELLYVNKHFEKVMRDRDLYSEELMREVAQRGSIKTIDNAKIPEDIKKIFVTALDIPPEWHVLMQAAFQKHVDSCISKTINFQANATIDDVETAYMAAWRLGCKGITIYRDKSVENQILNVQTEKPVRGGRGDKKTKEEDCSECKSAMRYAEGCAICLSCGHSVCF